MRAAAQTTLTASALAVGITAVGLTRAIFHLRAIQANLAGTRGATQAIAASRSSVAGVLVTTATTRNVRVAPTASRAGGRSGTG